MAETHIDIEESAALALLEDTFSGIDFGIALMDEELNFVMFNETYVDLAFGDGVVPKIGDSAAEVSRRQLASGFYAMPEGADPESQTEALVAAVKSCETEILLERSDGRWLEASAKRTKLQGYLVSVKDVTDRENAKSAEEARWQAITSAIEVLEEGFSLWDSDFRFVTCNDRYMELVAPYRDTHYEVGRPAEECIAEGYHARYIELPDDVSEQDLVSQYMLWARSHGGPMEVRYKNGKVVVASAKETDLGGVVVTAVDVTDERNTEAKALEMLSAAIESLEEGFALWDHNMGFVMCNQRYMDLVTPFRTEPFDVGTTIADSAREIIRAGLVDFPDGISEDEIIADVENFVNTFGEPREYHYKDGRVVVMNVKPTELGAFLVTAVDATDSKRAADAEAARRRAINDVVESLDEGFSLWDQDMRFLMCNDQYMKDSLPFRSAPPAVGTPGEDVIREAYHGGLNAIPEGMTEEDFVNSWIDWAQSHAGTVEAQFVDGRTVTLTSKKTELGGVLITTKDITEERNSEAKALDLLSDAIESLEEGFALWDSDWRLVMCNDQYMSALAPGRETRFEAGLPGDELCAEVYRTGHFPNPDGLSEDAFVDQWMTWAKSHGESIELTVADGRTFVFSSNRTRLGGVLVTAVDVTEERNSEKRARELVYDAMGSLEEGFALWDADMKFLMCNQKHIDLVLPFRDTPFPVGTTIEEGARETVMSGILDLPEDADVEDMVKDIAAWTRSYGPPREFQMADGRVVKASVKPTKLGGFLVTSLDLTAERSAEAKARDMLLDAFQTLDEGLVLCDENMNYIFGNDAWKRMMFEGFEDNIPEPGDSVAANFVQQIERGFYAIPEDMSEQDFFNWIMSEIAEHGKQVPYSSADGRHFLGSSHSTAFGGSLLFVRDVTKQHDAEENRLAAVNDALDAVDDPLALFSAGRRFVLGNKAWKDMVAGFAEPQPEDTADTLFTRLLENDFYKVPDGMTLAEYRDQGLQAMDALAENYPLSLTDGSEQLANVRKTGLDGFLISYRDVTEQAAMEAELEQQREIAHQNEKLSALGELLAGVAHELNNPLSVVFGYSQMLQDKIEDPVLSERVDLICQSSERAAKIVRTFLTMARQRPAKMEVCAVNNIVETALEISSYTLKTSGTQVAVELADAEPHVTGDIDQLTQVFSNLIINAGHAVSDKGSDGKIGIRTRVERNRVLIDIRDNGRGIPDDIKPRIFEPFFTTKDVGEGTGIGLAFSHRIVASHNGTLTVTSKVGEGAQFRVVLAAAEPCPIAFEQVAQPVLQGHRVLVVDDEEGVAQMIADMLVDEGFVVTKSTNPREALLIAERENFETILSDFKMPEMNGETFYNALAAIAPDSAERMGFITGDALSAQVVRFFETSGRPFVEKPIMKHELLQLIQLASGEEVP